MCRVHSVACGTHRMQCVRCARKGIPWKHSFQSSHLQFRRSSRSAAVYFSNHFTSLDVIWDAQTSIIVASCRAATVRSSVSFRFCGVGQRCFSRCAILLLLFQIIATSNAECRNVRFYLGTVSPHPTIPNSGAFNFLERAFRSTRVCAHLKALKNAKIQRYTVCVCMCVCETASAFSLDQILSHPGRCTLRSFALELFGETNEDDDIRKSNYWTSMWISFNTFPAHHHRNTISHSRSLEPLNTCNLYYVLSGAQLVSNTTKWCQCGRTDIVYCFAKCVAQINSKRERERGGRTSFAYWRMYAFEHMAASRCRLLASLFL